MDFPPPVSLKAGAHPLRPCFRVGTWTGGFMQPRTLPSISSAPFLSGIFQEEPYKMENEGLLVNLTHATAETYREAK